MNRCDFKSCTHSISSQIKPGAAKRKEVGWNSFVLCMCLLKEADKKILLKQDVLTFKHLTVS